MPEDVFYITAGEMDPVDFRLVLGEILVVLLLPWLEQDHMSCGDFLWFTVEVEDGLAGGHIQKLIVQPPSWAPGGEPFLGA